MAERKILDHIDHIVVHMIDRIVDFDHIVAVAVHTVIVDQIVVVVLDQVVEEAFAAVRTFVDYKLLLYFGTKQFPCKGTTNHLSIRRSLRIQSAKNKFIVLIILFSLFTSIYR